VTNDVQPCYLGNLVIVDRRVLRRVCGGEVDQGGAGQGAAATGDTEPSVASGLYDLSGAPDELRPFLEQEMKKVEANVTRKFQEAADFRKQWEPYSGVEGLTDIDPEELGQLLAFQRGPLSDEQQFIDWYQNIGQELGLLPEQSEDGGEDEYGEDGDGELDPALEGAIQRALDARLAPFEAQLSQQNEQLTAAQQEQRVNDAQQEIRGELDALREQHGDFNEDLVCQLALAYDGAPDMIQRAFADFQRFSGEAESSFVEGKNGSPAPANSGGIPATQVEPITDFRTAKEAARARFAQGA
jgi:hypothetical protein